MEETLHGDCHNLTVSAVAESIPAILKFTKNILITMGFDKHGIFDVQTAVDEACINIINHGYEKGQNGTIDIKVKKTEAGFVIVIQSRGKPFSPESVVQPDLTSSVSERRVGGLGVYFINQLMDKVSYECEDGLNTLTMRKYRNSDKLQ
ncbi:MAG: ATP-binding protein [Nitrospirae bacterium YQR-1]